jgi:lipopolysaccharide export system protein LptC
MTTQADNLRSLRRVHAAPGGAQDRLVQRLRTLLPALVGMIVAAMVVSPLFPRSEVSFLLDRRKVAITQDRLSVSSAVYRGQDDKGRPFSLSAGNAVQHSAQVPKVELRDLTARLQQDDGPATITAADGTYDISTETLHVPGAVTIRTPDERQLTASNVEIDLKHHVAYGRAGVEGLAHQGKFTAQSITVDLITRKVSLDGRAHLRMTAR